MDKASQEHLPARLWWVLVGLTLVWGCNWTAMKLAIAEVTPFTFRTLCLGLGSGVLFAVLRETTGIPFGVAGIARQVIRGIKIENLDVIRGAYRKLFHRLSVTEHSQLPTY